MQDLIVEKREFGRKPADIRGCAAVKGQPPKPFTIRDLAEGGALLSFDDASFEPPKSFRITIEGTDLVVMCEVRHQVSGGTGVRFIKPSEGMALQQHFLLRPVEGAARPLTELPRRPAPVLRPVRGGELRAALDIFVPAETLAARASAAEEAAHKRSWAATRMTAIRVCAAMALVLRSGDLVQHAAAHPSNVSIHHSDLSKRS